MSIARFIVNRDERGMITGISLTAHDAFDSSEMASYCVSFITAHQQRKARISFHDGMIVFSHDGLSPRDADPRFGVFGAHPGGIQRFPITDEERRALGDLFAGRGQYRKTQLRVRPETEWGRRGFTLCITK